MRDPLQGYLGRAYLYWYAPLLALGALLLMPLGRSIAYALGPLAALVSPLALFGVAFTLRSRHEIEALQTYGVSFRRFWRPLSVAAGTPVVALSLAGTVIAPRHGLAATVALFAAAASASVFAFVSRHAWRSTLG
ncbi:MAG TPA: hypothetical protein VJP76_04085 [Candidatus Tumulicola sp.]|nr:hypothetical protein [Candidatus Tumulicola sp.]